MQVIVDMCILYPLVKYRFLDKVIATIHEIPGPFLYIDYFLNVRKDFRLFNHVKARRDFTVYSQVKDTQMDYEAQK
jgi:hypothetical protein